MIGEFSAYVPKRNADANSTQGEAVSVISWNNLASQANPTKTTESLLKVDAGFISGIAANVASVPAGTTVKIEPCPTTVGVTKSTSETRNYEVGPQRKPRGRGLGHCGGFQTFRAISKRATGDVTKSVGSNPRPFQ